MNLSKRSKKDDYLISLTQNQIDLITNGIEDGNTVLQDHIESLLKEHIIESKGKYRNSIDRISYTDLYQLQFEYKRISKDKELKNKININTVADYYLNLAKEYNRIAIKRKISRAELWNLVKKNILLKNFNNTKLRIYKYITRGEIIPSPKFVINEIEIFNDLPCYLSIIYLDEIINPDLKISYTRLVE